MRALLVKTSSLGDVVHNLPVVNDILRHIPAVVVDWVVEESFIDIPRLHPGVNRVIPVAIRRWRRQLFATNTWREIAAFRRELRADSYDVVLDTQGLVKSALIARQAKLAVDGRRFGYAAETAREPCAACFYNAGFAIPKNAHAVDRNRWLAAAAFGYVLDEGSLDYGISARALPADWVPITPYAVMFTGTSRADKLWPEQNWIAVATALGMPAVLPAGSRDERERAQRIAARIPHGVVAPPLGIADLAGLLSGARIVIGLDTGLTHLGVALGKPAVAIFSGSDPALTGVLAAPGMANVTVNLGRAGASPMVEEVIAAARALLR